MKFISIFCPLIDKSPMITSINLGKSFDKNMQCSCAIKIPKELVIENFLNRVKNFYQNLQQIP